MDTTIIIIDMHCDALLPSGYSSSGGGNKYSRNLMKLLLSHNISFLYFTEQTYPELDSYLQLGANAAVYRIPMLGTDFEKDSPKDRDKALSFIQSVLDEKKGIRFLFHSVYWYSGHIADVLSNRYQSCFAHTVISNEKAKINQGAADSNAEQRCKTEQYIFEKAKYIICSSESEAKDLELLYHIQRSKLIVTGRIIDKDFVMPHLDLYGYPTNVRFSESMPAQYMPKPEAVTMPFNDLMQDWTSMKAFLYIGRIHENKGIVQIISAWGHLYHQYGMETPPLWIAGGSPEEIHFFKNTFALDLPFLSAVEKNYKLIWWGTLPPESISTLMSKSLVLITHSKYEAGGNVILEAMAHALPVIATPFGYGKDLIRHGENGYITAYNDIKSLEKYMGYFIKQPYLTNYMGRVASADMKQIIQDWNFEKKHLEIYGIRSGTALPDSEKPQMPCIPKDSVDAYFYRLVIPETDFISHLISTETDQKIIYIGEKENIQNYFLWEITMLEEKHYFYFLYDILNRRCLEENGNNHVITKYQRVKALEKECLDEGIVIYFLDESEGYAYVNRKVRNML